MNPREADEWPVIKKTEFGRRRQWGFEGPKLSVTQRKYRPKEMGWPTMDPINQNPGGLGEGGGPGNSRPGRWNDNVGPPADSEDGRAMKLKPAPHQAGARTPPGRSPHPTRQEPRRLLLSGHTSDKDGPCDTS